MNEFNLNKNIAELRKAAGLTQEQLASRLGISYQAVSKWENAQSCPDVMLLPRLAEIFGISIDALFGLEKAETAIVPVEEAVENTLPWDDVGGIYVVLYEGHRLITESPITVDARLKKIPLTLRGNPKNVTSVLSVTVDGDVEGDVSAGGSVCCDCVKGGVNAGTTVSCDAVGGDVFAGGSVSCDAVGGNVEAGGNVTCDIIGGSVRSAGQVFCDNNGDFHGMRGSFSIDVDDMTPEQKEKYENIKRSAENIADSAIGVADKALSSVEKVLKGIFKK